MPQIGVIGGSGLYGIPGFAAREEREVRGPHGEPSDKYTIAEREGVEIAFLPRHGRHHTIPPHRINYRANLWGFRELGVTRLISVSAAGGINTHLPPGQIVLTDQVIDFTQGARAGTFYDGQEVVHVDFTEPYCPELRQGLLRAGMQSDVLVVDGGTYICVNGPRLESRAEIEHFAKMGADMVGMTGMPEAALARELEICFANLTVITNFAAGISGERLTTEDVVHMMREATGRIKRLIGECRAFIPEERECQCKDALKHARMGG